jgi:hypothetical protein
LPGIFEWTEFAEAGGLLSYGANVAGMYRRLATYVDISKHVGRVNDESILVNEIAG